SRSRGARGPPPRLLLIRFPSWLTSEFQAALASRVGQRPDFAVVDVAAAVEDDLGDALLLRACGDELADLLGRLHVRADLALLLQGLVERRGRGHRTACGVVDDLRVDVLAALEDRETRPLGRAPDLLADPHAHAAARLGSLFRFHGLLPARLSDLAAN